MPTHHAVNGGLIGGYFPFLGDPFCNFRLVMIPPQPAATDKNDQQNEPEPGEPALAHIQNRTEFGEWFLWFR